MKDSTLLMQISAYADGELAPAEARALEARIARDGALAREVAQYKKLKVEAAALPVPSMDACLKNRKAEQPSLAPEAGADSLMEKAAQTLTANVPLVSAERFAKVWEKIAARTVAPPAEVQHSIRISAYFDNALSGPERLQAEADFASEMIAGRAPEEELRQWKRLDEMAALLPVPQISPLAAAELWHEIFQRTNGLSASERAAISRLESAAAALPVPQISKTRWDAVSDRLQSAMPEAARAPQVSAERWDKVWQGVAQRIQPAAVVQTRAASPASIGEKIRKIDFAPAPVQSRKHWGWAAVASFAAVAVFALLLTMISGSIEPEEPVPGPSTQVALQIPEVLDERYQQVQLEVVPGQEEPVICFFLKNDETNENEQQNWEWMPN